MHASKLTAAVVMSLSFVLVACGGGGGSPTTAPAGTQAGSQPTADGGGATKVPGGGSQDVCAIVSLADIKAATGADYPAGTADGSDCRWELTTADSYTNISVGFDTVTKFSAIKTAFPGGTDMTVAGHPAYLGVTGGFLQSLWVDVGTSVLSVIIAPAPANAQDVVKKLAEAAIAKM